MDGCRMCELFGIAGSNTEASSQLEHARRHYAHLLVLGEVQSLDKTREICFPPERFIPEVVDKKWDQKDLAEIDPKELPSFSELSRVYRDQKLFVTCNICGKRWQLRNVKGSVRCTNAIDHARMHVTKAAYSCRLCDFKISSRNALWMHLKLKHNAAATGNYDDNLAGQHKVVLKKFMECFNPKLRKFGTTSLSSKSKRNRRLHSQNDS